MPDLGIFLNSDMFLSQGRRLLWIRQRISRLTEEWDRAFSMIKNTPYFDRNNRKSILVFPGLLSEFSAYDFAENAFRGGYLGELIQWSDLIAGLYILGHRVKIVTQRADLSKLRNTTNPFDLVYTDYIGLNALDSEEMLLRYKCNLRVLDVYGTEPRFNFRTADFNIMEKYAKWNLEDTKQFWTFYPDTPDNSFLGFIIPQTNTEDTPPVTGKNMALVYGKLAQSLYSQKHNIPLLQMASEFFEVHSTFRDAHPHLPDNIINHGFLKSSELTALLRKSKVFIGLGYPYDGPAPFEALAEGTVFLQHKFEIPKNRENDKFFSGKPTSRSISSQHTYLERYVGEPYVYTIDTTDSDLFRSTLIKILKSKPLPPFIPYEFTSIGFLERLAILVSRLDPCDGRDTARGKQVNSSPHYKGFNAGYITNGVKENAYCFKSQPGTRPWIEVDLDTEVWIKKIRVTLCADWKTAIAWEVFNPFKVSLLDFTRRLYASKKFTDGRLSYVWDQISLPARYVQIEPIEQRSDHFILCGVEVYEDGEVKNQPSRQLLRSRVSFLGESCKETCWRYEEMCERNLFPLVNSLERIEEHLNCSFTMGPASHAPDFIDYAPAQYMTTENKPGMCVTNPEPMLFSCAGNHPSTTRICPCADNMKGQNGLSKLATH